MRAVALLLLLALAVGSVSAVAAKIPREKIVSRSENENEAGITTGSDELAVETTTGAVPETIIQPTTVSFPPAPLRFVMPSCNPVPSCSPGDALFLVAFLAKLKKKWRGTQAPMATGWERGLTWADVG